MRDEPNDFYDIHMRQYEFCPGSFLCGIAFTVLAYMVWWVL